MADYKEGIVESIKIATLEKQIEILEKLGLSKDEILEKMSDENTDILTIILNKIDSLYEQEEQALVEQLARTLLANQSEASVKYVIQHELIGKVLKHILENDSDNFDDKTIDEILSDKALASIVLNNDSIYGTYQNSTVFSKTIISNPVALDELTSTKEKVLREFRHDTPLRVQFCENKIALSKISEKYGHVYYIDYNLTNTEGKYRYTTRLEGVKENTFIALGYGVLFKTVGSRVTPYQRYSLYHPEDPINGLDSNHPTKIINESIGNKFIDGTFIVTIPTLNPLDYKQGEGKPQNAAFKDFLQLYQVYY